MFDQQQLLDYWNPNVERCGLILADGNVIEIPNTHHNPVEGFAFSKEVFTQHPTCVATWHTHPKGGANLSVEDYKAFLSYSDLFHYIVGDGIVWGFYVSESRVMLYEDGDI